MNEASRFSLAARGRAGLSLAMPRRFNTTGPCEVSRHYLLPPEGRLPDLVDWVEQELYFVLHAPRQTGKTTAMRALAERLRGRGYAALWASLEMAQGVEAVGAAEPIWLRAIAQRASALDPADRPPDPDPWIAREPGVRLNGWLRAWAAQTARPLVLLLDEADVLSGPALVSFLRQLRDGFVGRGIGAFPICIALIGMRDLRDYLTASKEGERVNPGSPFNIKMASLTLRNFSEEEVGTLLGQHTAETGQPFSPAAIQSIREQSSGQPYLVNALAARCVELAAGAPITADHVAQAREGLIAARATHLDALGQRLRDPRVAPIIEGLLLGDRLVPTDSDDYLFTVDLGLVDDSGPQPTVANPIYREVLIRELSARRQRSLPTPWWRYRLASGQLDMEALVDAFLGWWRENAAIVQEEDGGSYTEAVGHLTFMAFLQRVINGGGRVTREFAAGRGAVDLLVEYGGGRQAIELKRVRPRHDSLERVCSIGAAQLRSYLDSLDLEEGWLIVFDQRAGRSWEERLWRADRVVDGRTVHLRGA